MIRLKKDNSHKGIKFDFLKASIFMLTGTVGISLYASSFPKRDVLGATIENASDDDVIVVDDAVLDSSVVVVELNHDNVGDIKKIYVDGRDIRDFSFLNFCQSLEYLNISNANCLSNDDYDNLNQLHNCDVVLSYPLDYILSNPNFFLGEELVNHNDIYVNLTDYVFPTEEDVMNYVKYSFLKKSNASIDVLRKNFSDDIYRDVEVWYDKVMNSLSSLCLNKDMNEVFKEFQIENFVNSSIMYDDSYTLEEKHEYNVHSLGSILNIDGSMVGLCSNYSEYLDILNYEEGIDSHTIINTDIGHAYNVVQVDGEYKIVDATNHVIVGMDQYIYVDGVSYRASDYYGDSPVDKLDKIYCQDNLKNLDYINRNLDVIKGYLFSESEYLDIVKEINLDKKMSQMDTNLLLIYLVRQFLSLKKKRSLSKK